MTRENLLTICAPFTLLFAACQPPDSNPEPTTTESSSSGLHETGGRSTSIDTTETTVDEPLGTSTSDGETTSTSDGETTSTTDTSSSDGTEESTSSSGADGTDTDGIDDCTFIETFDGIPNGSPWPAPWIATTGVLLADVQNGRGRLVPIISDYSLARMVVPMSCTNVEGSFTFEMTDPQNQGVGFYLRQNGGYLTDTMPPGAGYCSFSQAFTAPNGISLWREIDGQEIILAPYTPSPIMGGVEYAVRFRVTQLDPATTRLQTRIWATTDAEPVTWDIDMTDSTASLQNQAGGLAIDVWSMPVVAASDVFVDDIVVMAAP